MTDRQTVSTADYEQLKRENEELKLRLMAIKDIYGIDILISESDGETYALSLTTETKECNPLKIERTE